MDEVAHVSWTQLWMRMLTNDADGCGPKITRFVRLWLALDRLVSLMLWIVMVVFISYSRHN